MDIRSIIDAEPTSTTPKRPVQATRDENKHEVRPLPQSSPTSFQSPYGAPPPYHIPRDSRPPQPPPLQPPEQNDFRSPSLSSYHSAQSPYQPTPTSALGGAQYPFPQNPIQSPYSSQGPHYAQRDGNPGVPHQSPTGVSYSQYGQPAPLPQTPTASTPGSSQTYYNHGQPQSSHSVTTPTSALPHTPNFPRQSPSTSHAQIRGQAQSFSAQQYLSQPTTPLGPPSNFAKSGGNTRKESPGSYGHSRNHSGGSYSYKSLSAPSPSTEHPGSAFDSPSTVGHRQAQLSSHGHSTSVERERSLSVSPKTRLPSQPKIDVSKPAVTHYHDHPEMFGIPLDAFEQREAIARSEDSQPAVQNPSRSFSLGVNGILNAPTVNEFDRQTKKSPGNATSVSPQVVSPPHRPPVYQRTSSQSDSRNMPDPASHDVTPSKHYSSARQISHHGKSYQNNLGPNPMAPIQESSSTEAPAPQDAAKKADLSLSQTGVSNQTKPSVIKSEDNEPPAPAINQTVRKRRREEDVPVYAQSSRKGSSNNPFLLGKRPVNAEPPVKREPLAGNNLSSQMSSQSARPETNGHPMLNTSTQMPMPQPSLPSDGLLGPWEASILNIVPHDEITKQISDILFTEVVLRDDVGVMSNKGIHSQVAVLEIEAKIGQLMDKNTNERLRLPVMSECVFKKSDPNYRISFESSMTESQHKELNGFLNTALINSKKGGQGPRKRIELDYAHTYETDTFHELSQEGMLSLPSSIRNQINPHDRRTRPKVRITKDTRTGATIASIIKVRAADIEIFSPQTPFDWRVSVSVEMKIEGDLQRLIVPEESGKVETPRNKDRLSYKHLQYQIDLTQVTEADAKKRHELEIEVASQEIRTQGLLALDNKPNMYEELVKGFVDNVRVLARHCKSH